MDSHGLPSPPLTQSLVLESPAEALRSWLSQRGISSNTVDRFWAKHNQQLSSFDQEYWFLTILKDVVAEEGVVFATQDDLGKIDKALESATRSKNAQLREQSGRAISKVAIDTVRVLPGEIRLDFLDFLKSDSINARHKFLANVLPWMSQNLKQKQPDETPEQSPYSKEEPLPMKARVNRQEKKNGRPKTLRRSHRVEKQRTQRNKTR